MDWTPVSYAYDGSFAGFLTCVFASYAHREEPMSFSTPEDGRISLWPERTVDTDEARAQRVYRSLAPRLGQEGRRLAVYGFLTCLEERELHLWRFLRLGYDRGPWVVRDLTDDRVAVLTRAVGHLTGEAHLLKGFTRFSEQEGVLVGEIAPKNRVLPLLRPHFCARYPHVRIRLLNYSAPQAVKALENNIIDFAIVSTPVLVHKHMHQEKLVSYDEILLGGTKYKQFAQQVHYLEDISEMPLIGLCEGSSTHTHYSRFFMEHDLPFEPDMEAAMTDQVLPMITHNLGIGFYPKSLALEAIEKELVFPIELTEPLPNRDVVVITNNHTPINSAARRFLEFLLENRK